MNLFNGDPINWDAYREGQEAWVLFNNSGLAKQDMNPYVLCYTSWRSWNKGWNSNYTDEEKR